MMQRRKLRVGVIFGGRSGEHEVSLLSARSVLASLDATKYEVVQIGISHDGAWWVGENVLEAFARGDRSHLTPAALLPDPTHVGLYRVQKDERGAHLELLSSLDVVFPVLHGTYGEDGTLQGLLEMADLAYVGAGVLGSALGMDKGVFKAVMRAEGIPVVDWTVFTRRQIEQSLEQVVEQAMQLADFPLFIKPANLGSSVGVTRCLSVSDVVEGLKEAARYDRRVLVERGLVRPREIEVSVLGNEEAEASIPGEIIPSREFYSYEAKYLDGRSELLIPAPLSEEMTRRVQDLALRAYHAIDCAGMARVDFLMEREAEDGGMPQIYLSEVNTIPGFTKISMYAKLWEYGGLSYSALLDRLIALALERKAERDRTERRYRKGEG